MHKGECIVKNSNKNKLKVVLGITLSGIVIIVALGIILYRNKFRKKELRNFLFQGQHIVSIYIKNVPYN